MDPYPLLEPQDVEVDQTSHDIYVADSGNHRVEKFDSAGTFLLMFGKEVNRTAVENSRAADVNVCPPPVIPVTSASPAPRDRPRSVRNPRLPSRRQLGRAIDG